MSNEITNFKAILIETPSTKKPRRPFRINQHPNPNQTNVEELSIDDYT